MRDKVLADRYAKAFLDLGVEEKSMERFQEELERFSTALRLEPMLMMILSAREMAAAKRLQILDGLMQKLILSPLTQNFLRLLMKRRRISLFKEIAKSFEEQLKAQDNIVVAQVTVASLPEAKGLMEDLRQSLERMTGKTVQCELKEDTALIGGMQVRIGDEIYDASIQGELGRFYGNSG